MKKCSSSLSDIGPRHFNPDRPHFIPNQNMLNKEKFEAEEEMCFLREQNRTRCFSRILTLFLFVT